MYGFSIDNTVTEVEQAESTDYKGHMMPWGDTDTLYLALESNLYINVAPMSDFNRGIWLTLENSIRSYVRDSGNLVNVITGAISSNETIGDGVEVLGFYKIIYDERIHLMSAYLIYQDEDLSLELDEYAVTVADIEKLTGYDFNTELSETDERVLEGTVNTIL